MPNIKYLIFLNKLTKTGITEKRWSKIILPIFEATEFLHLASVKTSYEFSKHLLSK